MASVMNKTEDMLKKIRELVPEKVQEFVDQATVKGMATIDSLSAQGSETMAAFSKKVIEKTPPAVLEKAELGYALVLTHLTAYNVSLGVSGLLALAGLVHAIPGPSLKMQAKQLGAPAYFIMAAGVLMMASAALFHVRPVEGLASVSFCMGGAAATALKMPAPLLMRLQSFVFSHVTLYAAYWSFTQGHWVERYVIGLCAAGYVAGVIGRVVLADAFATEEETKAAAPAEPATTTTAATAQPPATPAAAAGQAQPKAASTPSAASPAASPAGTARARVATPPPPKAR